MKRLVLAGSSLLGAATLLGGCGTMVLFDPKGPVGAAERFVILVAIALMLLVIVPVFVMACWFPLKYRATNAEATYMPKWSNSATIEFFMWAVPVAIVTALSALAWTTTHALDPYEPIPSAHAPIAIEAVSLDWKWLFIYPDENIATVNEVAFPVDVPVSFRLTSDTVMTSFFIPQLGSQIYAMAGMQTRLHLLAAEPGVYAGHNQQISGRGYADMHFQAHAVSADEYRAWVQKVRQSPEKLYVIRYEQLAKPSDGYHPVTWFSAVEPGLFEYILHKSDPSWGAHAGDMTGAAGAAPAGTVAAEGM